MPRSIIYLIAIKGGDSMFKFLKISSYTLIILGAINWGLIGVFQLDLIATLFGDMSVISRFIYSIVGLGAFISIITTYIYCSAHKEC